MRGVSARVTLRPATGEEREVASRWLGPALELPDDALAIVRGESGAVVGVVGYRVDMPAGWLKVGPVALAEGSRGWGLGSEAVRLLEETVGATQGRSWTGVPRGMGLAFYFWLRLGYRPARPDEAPWQAAQSRDIMAMLREENPGPRT